MLQRPRVDPKRVLMTVDAVGGVWRHAMELGTALAARGIEVIFAGLGPLPAKAQREEAERIGRLAWLDAPLDWMVEEDAALNKVPDVIGALAADVNADLLHLNLPSQAARLQVNAPVLVVSHSCVVTWFHGVRRQSVPASWHWQASLNRAGFDAARAVVAPSHSHAAMLEICYGPIRGLTVIPNGIDGSPPDPSGPREDFIFAAGRWWDEGKNGRVLDEAAAMISWPVMAAGPTRGPNGQSFSFRNAKSLGEESNREVRQAMARAGIVVSPSIYEPFGLAALEAARAGSALVLADIPTYRELWGKAAIFADPYDPAAFGAAIETLIGDRALRHELGRQALKRSKRYATAAQAEAFLALYRQLMAASLPVP